jgi:DNA-binding GntR family transcriptional regulator
MSSVYILLLTWGAVLRYFLVVTIRTLPALKTTAIRDSVAPALRQALLDGLFRPGEDLSEVSLAKQLHVSRGPVREALMMLAQEGLVVHEHNRGFSVFQLSESDFTEIPKVRLALEAQALECARDRVSPSDLGELGELKNQIVAAYEQQDFARTTRHDFEFHSLLWEKTGNKWLILALRRIMVPYFTFTMIYKREHPLLTKELLDKQHEWYLEFLRGATSRSASECVHFHLCLFLPPSAGAEPAAGGV